MFGVRSAMPLRTAARSVPTASSCPSTAASTGGVSREVMAILRRFTPLVEPISIDEAFLDVTGSRALFGDGESIARLIKATIHDELGLTASVGVAPTKLVAKIASDLRKPDGLVVVPPGDGGGVPGAAADLAAVGRRASRRPTALRELRRARRSATSRRCRSTSLVRRFGKHRRGAARASARASTRPGRRAAMRRSRSATSTRSTSTRRMREVIERTLLAHGRGRRRPPPRLRPQGGHDRASSCATRTFRTITRQRTLAEPTDLTEPIYRAALELARAGDARASASGCSASRASNFARAGAAWRCSRRPTNLGDARRRGRRRGPRAVRRPCRHSCAARGRPSADAVRARPDDRRRAASRHARLARQARDERRRRGS